MDQSTKRQSSGRKIAMWIAIALAIAVVFVVVMCTAGDPKFLQPDADHSAPNN